MNDPRDNYTRPVAIPAEGARVGIVSCLSCGMALLLDPRDEVNVMGIHAV